MASRQTALFFFFFFFFPFFFFFFFFPFFFFFFFFPFFFFFFFFLPVPRDEAHADAGRVSPPAGPRFRRPKFRLSSLNRTGQELFWFNHSTHEFHLEGAQPQLAF